MKPQFSIAWKRWHYDTPTWVVARARFNTIEEARTEQKTFGNLTTRIVVIKEVK